MNRLLVPKRYTMVSQPLKLGMHQPDQFNSWQKDGFDIPSGVNGYFAERLSSVARFGEKRVIVPIKLSVTFIQQTFMQADLVDMVSAYRKETGVDPKWFELS